MGGTLLLTVATLMGLVLGFARELLMVHDWGVGARSDAILVALFLPEVVRMTFAGGLVTNVAVPLLAHEDEAHRPGWIAAQCWQLLALGLLVAGVLVLGAPWWVRLIGPGLSAAFQQQAQLNLQVLAWCVPALALHALFSAMYSLKQRFLLVGLGSFWFNLPGVAYLAWLGHAADPQGFAWMNVLGSALMLVSLLPRAGAMGWDWRARPHWASVPEFYRKLGPLLASTMASHGLAWVERVLASHAGEGGITLLNLARKLMNLPLVALASLCQVWLARMAALGEARLALLRHGLLWASWLALPTAAGAMLLHQPLLLTLMPMKAGDVHRIGWLVVWLGLGLVLGSWNALLARYFYAERNTHTPLKLELMGNAVNLILALLLSSWLGLVALPLAATAGVAVTAILLLRAAGGRTLLRPYPWRLGWGVALVSLLPLLLPWWLQQSSLWQASVGSVLVLALLLAAWPGRADRPHGS